MAHLTERTGGPSSDDSGEAGSQVTRVQRFACSPESCFRFLIHRAPRKRGATMRHITIAKINDRAANLLAVASFGKRIDALATLGLRALQQTRSLSMRLTSLATSLGTDLSHMGMMRHVMPVGVTAGATRVHESYSSAFMSRRWRRWAKPGPGATFIKR